MTVDRAQSEGSLKDATAARRPRVPGGWGLVVLLALIALGSLAVDRGVSQWCKAHSLPGDMLSPLDWAEVFGHGVGVAILLMVVWVLDPAHRRAIPRLAAIAYGAGLAANLVKMFVARMRPRAFDLDQGVFDSFGRLFSFGSGGSDCQSLPSAHVAVAVGLALGLGWLYPRGRFLFLLFAAMVAAQRIIHCSHFCSDALLGAAVGCLLAVLLLDVGPLARWIDRKEASWGLHGEAFTTETRRHGDTKRE